MLILACCLAAHVFSAGVIASPWWVPNFTLVGLIVTVTRRPGQWMWLSGAAGLLTIVWAARFPQQILVGYLGLGCLVQWLARQWDVGDWRVQCALVGIAALLMSLGALWLEDLWSLCLLGLAAAQVMMTVIAVPFVRRLARSMR